MFLNIFSEKWSISDFKNFMDFMMIYKLYENHLTPGRYPKLHFGRIRTNYKKFHLCLNDIL